MLFISKEKILSWLYQHSIFNRILTPIKRIRRFIRSHTASNIPIEPYRFTKKDAQKVYTIIRSGKLNHRFGPETSSLEKEFADYHNVTYALATNSGTSALEMAVKAIGIKPGDEVIVPAYTFVATAQAVLSRGGIPVFADIDDTYTISPESIKQHISKRTKAIIVVHIFGNVCDMKRINAIAKLHNLRVIEDSCQSIGASYDGVKTGALGDIGCFSFNETKGIYTGQGGMLITSNKKFYDIANVTRETGQIDVTLGSDVQTTGNTYALTEMQASLARSILQKLDALNERRRMNFDRFMEKIGVQPLPLHWYRINPSASPSFSRLAFLVDFNHIGITRETVLTTLQAQGVPMKSFYPTPLYRYSLFQKRYDTVIKSAYPFNLNTHVQYKNTFLPNAEQFFRQHIGMNFSPYLTPAHIKTLCTVLQQQLGNL